VRGRQAALGDIAEIYWERGAVQLRRINGQRIERVEATIDRRVTSKGLVEDLVSEELLPALEAQYPGLMTWDEAIATDEDAETESGLMLATIAVLVTIFVLIGAYARSLRHSALLLAALPLSATWGLAWPYLVGH
jgi:multidrug efflux pump subunit AcrB